MCYDISIPAIYRLHLNQKTMKNLPQFRALIIRYETITIEEIEKANCNSMLLTGLGGNSTCTLCKAAGYVSDKKACKHCVYSLTEKIIPYGVPCNSGSNAKTYDAMWYANVPKVLLTAYRLRAKHMRSILKKLNIEMP